MQQKLQSSATQGRNAEDLACDYLEGQGLVLIERNYRCRSGELDLVMKDGCAIVFVEVRSRRSNRYGTPAETVTRTKQKRLIRAAARYLLRHRIDAPCRFDVVAVIFQGQVNRANWIIDWIKDAFQTV